MSKFLGQTGLIYLWQKIKNYVSSGLSGKQDVIDGSHKLSADLLADGTSNKVYTSAEKTKLAGVAAGAEVNQNAFSKVKVGSSTLEADSKTDTLEIAAGDNVTLTPTVSQDKVTIGVSVPKKVSDLTNDSGFITSADVPEGAAASTTTPLMDGTAAVGTETAFARGDHRHPSDTGKADKKVPAVNGNLAALDSTGNLTDSGYKISPNFKDTDTKSIPTAPSIKAAIENAIEIAQTGYASFQGTLNAFSELSNVVQYDKGMYWVVGKAGTYLGQECEPGDMIFCVKDKGASFKNEDFNIVQVNLSLQEMTTAEMDTATQNWS